MSTKINFEIGQKVKWTAGSVECKGVFLKDNGDGAATIVVHYIGNVFSGVERNVMLNVLELQ